jgi:hypothetical protein
LRPGPPLKAFSQNNAKNDGYPDWKDYEGYDRLPLYFCVAFGLFYLLDTGIKPSGTYLGTPISTLAGHPEKDRDSCKHLPGEQRLRVQKAFIFMIIKKTCCRIAVYKISMS